MNQQWRGQGQDQEKEYAENWRARYEEWRQMPEYQFDFYGNARLAQQDIDAFVAKGYVVDKITGDSEGVWVLMKKGEFKLSK